MLIDRMDQHLGTRVLFILACLVVVTAGLRAASPILVPFFVALFLAVLSLPIMFSLRRRRIPAPLAVLAAVSVVVGIFALVGMIASQSVPALLDRLPVYVSRLRGLFLELDIWLEDQGVPEATLDVQRFDPDQALEFASAAAGRLASFVTNSFLVLLVMVFILGEASVFPRKFRHIFGGSVTRGGGRLQKMVTEVQEYLVIKTLVSLATGLFVGLFAWWFQLDFPVLLGLTAFVLNYVPTIGSIIASAPGVLLALIQYGYGGALFVALVYLGVNTLFGNIIEPTLLGRRLGLSPLVVILSLLFWGWVWGPIGALLAVPLTMAVKIMLENTSDFRWVAILLDKGVPVHSTAATTQNAESTAQ